MKEKGVHEGLIDEATACSATASIAPTAPRRRRTTKAGCVDDRELRDGAGLCKTVWPTVTTDNLREITGYAGYKHQCLQLFGFDRSHVDDDAEVEADRRFDCMEV